MFRIMSWSIPAVIKIVSWPPTITKALVLVMTFMLAKIPSLLLTFMSLQGPVPYSYNGSPLRPIDSI